MTPRWDLLWPNLIAPGFGQFRARRWLTGTSYLVLELAALAWATGEVIIPIWLNVQQMLADAPANDPLRTIALTRLALAVVLSLVIWAGSFLELLIFPPRRKPPPPA